MKNIYKFFALALMALSLSACQSYDPPSNLSSSSANRYAGRNAEIDQMGLMPENSYGVDGVMYPDTSYSEENTDAALLQGRNGVDLSNFDPNNIAPENIICTVYFGFDQYAIAASERDKLRQVAQLYASDPSLNTVLVARTDWYGTEEYNILLSDKRASSVSEYLETNAVNPANMQPLSLGKAGAVPNVSKSSKEANRDRRVDIVRCR